MGESLFRSPLKESVVQSPRGVVYFGQAQFRGGGGRLFPDTLKFDRFIPSGGIDNIGGDDDVAFIGQAAFVQSRHPRTFSAIKQASFNFPSSEERVMGIGGGTQGRTRDASQYKVWMLVGFKRGGFVDQITSIYRLNGATFSVEKRVNFSRITRALRRDIGGDFNNVFMVHTDFDQFTGNETSFVRKLDPESLITIRSRLGPGNGTIPLWGCGGGENGVYILAPSAKRVDVLEPETLEDRFSRSSDRFEFYETLGGN